MDDGRHFTDYRPNCHINNLVRANNAILNSHQCRMFLQHNGNKLMDLNRTYACQKIAADPVRLNTTKVPCFQNNLYNNVTIDHATLIL